LDDAKHQFIFGLKFLRNESFLKNKDPPGQNISEPIEELIYYTRYLIDEGLLGLFPELYKQLKSEYRHHLGASTTWSI